MAATVEGLKAYLKEPPEDVELYLQAAKDKAKTAGVLEFKCNAQYDLFIYTLAAIYYDYRGMAVSEINKKAQDVVNSFVLELRHADRLEEPKNEL